MTLDDLLLPDFEARARERLPAMVYDYYAGGAGDEVAVGANRAAWQAIKLHYRVLVDVSERTTGTRLLGTDVTAPLLIAPTAFQGLAHPDGEAATAAAAGAHGVPMVLSSLSTTPVETVVAASAAPVWFQLYVFKDRAVSADLVARVEAAGCAALVVTVDAPLLGRRERDVRNGFHLHDGLAIENMLGDGYRAMPADVGESGLATYFHEQIDPALSWSDLDWLRSITKLPILVKGVVRPDDARTAAEHGAVGVIVSNHGGRQLSAAPATATVLPAVVDAAGDQLEIYVDGGIRRGEDVVRALAMGARGVLLGRSVLWGLAAGGQAGVSRVLSLLRDELDVAMALCGCRSVGEITADLLGP